MKLPWLDKIREAERAATPPPWECTWTVTDNGKTGESTYLTGPGITAPDGSRWGTYIVQDPDIAGEGGFVSEQDAWFTQLARDVVPGFIRFTDELSALADEGELIHPDTIRLLLQKHLG
jgi:hypothetical protein